MWPRRRRRKPTLARHRPTADRGCGGQLSTSEIIILGRSSPLKLRGKTKASAIPVRSAAAGPRREDLAATEFVRPRPSGPSGKQGSRGHKHNKGNSFTKL